jgi:hypothetical protein
MGAYLEQILIGDEPPFGSGICHGCSTTPLPAAPRCRFR